jgi:hypothetical protein
MGMNYHYNYIKGGFVALCTFAHKQYKNLILVIFFIGFKSCFF